MSQYTQTACPECNSSDAFTIYEDTGWGVCFSCEARVSPERIEMNDNSMARVGQPDPISFDAVGSSNKTGISTIAEYSSAALGSRKISRDVVSHFNVRVKDYGNGKASHFYPYTKNGTTVAYKERQLPKDFRVHGDFKGTELFGQSNSSQGKMLVITEGELDALSVSEAYWQKYNRFYPVVSIPSAAGIKTLLEQREWVNSFQEVIIFPDRDDAGNNALEKMAKIIAPGKAKVVKVNHKDASDMLIAEGAQAVVNAIWDAKPWNPAGIVQGEDIWKAFQERQQTESIPYPPCLDGLNQKLQGIRHGEITLFTSGTGSGKSTVIKEIILDLLIKTDDKIGLISLEESIGDTADKFISMAIERSTMGPPPIDESELRRGFDMVFKDERLVLLDHQGSVSDTSLIDKIEYMALMGCKYLVLDHITIAVSEGSEGLSGNEAVDKIMSDLLKVVKRHDVWLGLISHLRKATGGRSFEEGNLASIDDIKGSGSIKQISFDIISFARNLVADDEHERNTIKFRVLKSRFTGRTGEAGAATYNPNTGRLTGISGDFYAV